MNAAEKADLARLEADRAWRALSVSTDFESRGDAREYPWEKK